MEYEFMHYIEKFYPNGKTIIEKVSRRNPILIENDGLDGFRFFDVPKNSTTNEENRLNVSGMYYFGERKLSDESLDGSNSVIYCDNGSIIRDLTEDDETIEEYKLAKLIEEENGILVERKPVLSALAKILSQFENDDFSFKENSTIFEDEHTSENIDAWWIESKRTYSIYLADAEIVHHTMTSSINTYYNGTITNKEDNDIFTSFGDLRESLMPIIGSYPYLLWFLDQIKSLVQCNGGKITEVTVLDLADEYLDNLKNSKGCVSLK